MVEDDTVVWGFWEASPVKETPLNYRLFLCRSKTRIYAHNPPPPPPMSMSVHVRVCVRVCVCVPFLSVYFLISSCASVSVYIRVCVWIRFSDVSIFISFSASVSVCVSNSVCSFLCSCLCFRLCVTPFSCSTFCLSPSRYLFSFPYPRLRLGELKY